MHWKVQLNKSGGTDVWKDKICVLSVFPGIDYKSYHDNLNIGSAKFGLIMLKLLNFGVWTVSLNSNGAVCIFLKHPESLHFKR